MIEIIGAIVGIGGIIASIFGFLGKRKYRRITEVTISGIEDAWFHYQKATALIEELGAAAKKKDHQSADQTQARLINVMEKANPKRTARKASKYKNIQRELHKEVKRITK